MQLWETLLLISVFCFAVLIYHIVVVLRRVAKTVDDVEKTLAAKTREIEQIIENVNGITASASSVAGKISGTVDGIDRVVGAVRTPKAAETAMTLKKVVDALGVLTSALGFFKNRRRDREIEELLREKRQKNKK